MHDLKKRFEPVKLSDAQKERILNNVDKPVRPRSQKGPLFASVIVGLAMLFLMFNLLTEPETILQPGGGQAAEQGQDSDRMTTELSIWNTVAVSVMIFAIIATKRAIFQVKRWQSIRIVQRLQLILGSTWKLVGLMLAFAAVIWGGSLLLNGALLYTHIWVAVFYVIVFFMLAVYHTRDLGKTSCPHCGVEFTRKQVRQKTKWQYRETCDTCEKPVYVDPKRNGDTLFLVFPAFIFFNGILNMHYLLVMAMVIVSFWLVYQYISPYSIQFIAEKKDDPKMW